ncbi:RHS repeat-associated core domain-containing protein [Pseudomonas sp. G166]|uniref:RHS repeat-associated core domain-containing protein n=1 Tax=Pseudomonas sp. G166 TaxID=3094846 RepID=UPI003008C770
MPAILRKTVLCRYHYDPLDRLVDCTPSAEVGIQRFYCKSRLATEIQGAVQRSVFQHDDQLLAQLRHEGSKVETTLLATDQQRSVLSALDATRPHPIAYTPYGHRPAENGLLSLLGFNGERPDPVTGHYLLGNGYRAFNPVLMRFNSPDSWSPFGERGLNAYGYGIGDPINRSDPTGHTPVRPFLKPQTQQPFTPRATTSTSSRARRIRPPLAEKRAMVQIAKDKEAALGEHKYFTVNRPLDDVIEAWNQYEFLRMLRGFDKHQKIFNKWAFPQPDGTELINTIAFDTRIDLARLLRDTENLEKLNDALSSRGSPTVNLTTSMEIIDAEIARYRHLQRFTGIQFIQDIRQPQAR